MKLCPKSQFLLKFNMLNVSNGWKTLCHKAAGQNTTKYRQMKNELVHKDELVIGNRLLKMHLIIL